MKVNLKKTNLNYKNVLLLRKFITPEGKILPRRLTQVPLHKHKQITNCIKNARIVSFIPFKRMTFY
uniref:Small ribosomal subunit protein bS18c n=1 Tax=Codium arabicum TaxID=221038 RepID=A0A386B0N6_CODAR|nr:ribosomal protein S18 [Codium arabicum]AYC65250.1 ribosomal protein S18 [Codium arabicum]